MVQEIIAYIILAIAVGYMGYRFYNSIKKQHACDKCGLMEAVKKK
jgi:FeoB-associated Cys-rich membrane protein